MSKRKQSDFPNSFRYLRFNDAIFLGIDVDSRIAPSVGHHNISEGYSVAEMKEARNTLKKIVGVPNAINYFDVAAFRVMQFIGIVSRLHNFINKMELDIHMPGCRTILSSGLRYRFFQKKSKKEDYYSANFSLSNAYLANDMGSKYGFKGSNAYMENNVAKICGFNPFTKRLLGYIKFLRINLSDNPFSGQSEGFRLPKNIYKESQGFEVDLFNKKYFFREFNSITASCFQYFPFILEILAKNEESDKIRAAFAKMLNQDSPRIEEITLSTLDLIREYPILLLSVPLEENIHEQFRDLMSHWNSIKGMYRYILQSTKT